MNLVDLIVTGGILFLLLFTPLAFGAVHPWAFSLMEGVIFFLVVVWMGKLLFARSSTLSSFYPFSLLFSLLLFVGLLIFQLLPLPPSLLHSLSPATYEIYTRSLPGWPEKIPYSDLRYQGLGNTEVKEELPVSSEVFLPTPEEVQRGVPVPLARNEEFLLNSSPLPPNAELQLLDASPDFWRPLSLAPVLTRMDLLKLLAYLSLFFLVLLYPFEDSRKICSRTAGQRNRYERSKPEERFFRAVFWTILCSGLFVAFIGVVQRFSSNGKILWFFVPYDWETANQGFSRANGPFVNPNHFAGYLALIFPLALVGTISTRFFVSQERGMAFRLFCGLVAFVLLTGILLSLSRGGWIGTALGIGALAGIFFSLPEEKRPSVLRKSKNSAVYFAVASFLFLMLALVFIGSSGRSQVDLRLEETVMQKGGLDDRVAVWQDSLKMIRDFPFWGVGLGAWQELFPRYQRPPWFSFFYREAHNDYLELMAETGLIGFSLLAWFFWRGGRRLVHAFPLLSSRVLPVFTALVVALGVMAFHEFFDFNLQIPANALLFTTFFAIALRMTGGNQVPDSKLQDPESRPQVRSLFQVLVVAGAGVVAAVLCVFAFRQEPLPYPHNLKAPHSVAEARQLLLSHPARASTHLSLFRLLQGRIPLPEQFNILETALWLDPANPYARDLYAQSLLQKGREEEGLREITLSISFSPVLSTHPYLNYRFIPWLSTEEQKAVERGFEQAIASGNGDAAVGFGLFYDALGRLSEEGKVYEEAAVREKGTDMQLAYLLAAGFAYARAEDKKKAEALLRQAIAIAPQDPRAYQYLVTHVFGPKGDMASAKATVTEGIQQGADPFSLYFSLGEAARAAKNGEEAKTAFLQALSFQPSSEAHMYLGLVYIQEGNFDRAVLSLYKAVELNSTSAVAFFYLGTAEEARYQLHAAEKAYAQAVKLAPGNVGFHSHYETFRRKMEAEDRAQWTQ